MNAEDVLGFWFREIEPAAWWKKDESFDALVIRRFSELHERARRCELSHWRRAARGRLAEIIVLDQFSRNMFRDRPEAFAQDAQALTLAQEAVAQGADRELDTMERVFLYLPFMHSESLLVHEQALGLYEELGQQENLDFERRHYDILKRFGRYPHRNAVLGRRSTDEEIEFLKQPGSAF